MCALHDFALRCLADEIPVRARVVRPLLTRRADELLRETGAARFSRYSQAIRQCQQGLSGPMAQRFVNEIVPGLADPDPQVRRRAAESLGRLGASTPAAVNALISALDDPDPQLRYAKPAKAGSEHAAKAG